MARKRDEADDLLGDLALVADPKLNMALRPSAALRRQVDNIISDPKNRGGGRKTGQGACLCRKRSVACAANRTRTRRGFGSCSIFYGCAAPIARFGTRLTDLGRQSFHTEGAGSIAHYFAEVGAGAALLSPKVATALSSLSAFDHRPGGHLPVAPVTIRQR